MPTWPSPRSERLGTPNPPAIRFARGTSFGASRFTHLLRPAKLLALLYGSDRCARPPRAFTSRLPTGQSSFPLLDMTTTATGLLCWRDSPPRLVPPQIAPQWMAPLCSPASQLLWRGATSRVRASSATVPHLPDADRRTLQTQHIASTARHEISQVPMR